MAPRQGLPSVSPAFEADALASLDSLYRTALRLTRVPADAEDLVQDTYLKAFRAAGTFKPGTNLRAWLFTILHNSARNRLRGRARDRVDVDSEMVDRAAQLPPPGGVAETPETQLLRNTLAPELQAAIDALPAAFRQAVWLRDVEEFSYAEIAEMLSVPVGTVMSRISRGRRLLFETLSVTEIIESPVATRRSSVDGRQTAGDGRQTAGDSRPSAGDSRPSADDSRPSPVGVADD
jgi:RNA polymerase sigma-70 factor, ECF subfamily